MPHAYDLVGTLAEVTYPNENLTSVIYKPTGSFVIVTAQGAGSHNALYKQVREQFPNVTRIHSVRVGTDKQEGQRKAAVLKRIAAHSYTDNNANILKVIKELLPGIRLYHMVNGRKRAFSG
jgi:hypothetical protein